LILRGGGEGKFSLHGAILFPSDRVGSSWHDFPAPCGEPFCRTASIEGVGNMWHRLFLGLGIIAVVALVTAAVADDPDKAEKKKGKGKGRPTAEMIFKKMDADGDGKVTLEEFKKHEEARAKEWEEKGEKFKEKFKDKFKGKGKGGNPDRRFKMIDTDGKGYFTLDEFKKHFEERERFTEKFKEFKKKYKDDDDEKEFKKKKKDDDDKEFKKKKKDDDE
jgi:EF hand